jgi:Nitroreductase family
VVSRRSFVLGAGGLALVAGGGIWRVTRMPLYASAPWTIDPSAVSDVRLYAFAHAILAPNPHNRQPWQIRLEGDDSALITCDLDKRLPQTDPFDRQITIGFGAFVELARIAAAQRGVAMEVEPFPDGEARPRLDARPLARLRFIADPQTPRDPLYGEITKRRSNKDAYDMAQAVPEALASKIVGDDGGYATAAGTLAPLRASIVEAVTIETKTPRTYLESVRLIRIGHAEVDASPDGIDLSGPMIEALKLAGQIDRAELADTQSFAYSSGLDQMRATYGSIPALVWIITPANTRRDQLEAGRRYVRANLRATALGLAMHPLSQSLQEYAEVAKINARVHQLLGAKGGERVQMLARVGYGPATGPSPRWPLRTHIIA